MNDFKNTKTHLDEFFAEARSSQNIAPAEDFLKAGSEQRSFKNGFAKVGFAGCALVAVLSFLFLNDDAFKSGTPVVKNAQEVFTKEIAAEKTVVLAAGKNDSNPVLKAASDVFKKEPAARDSIQPEDTYIALQQSPESVRLRATTLVELQDFELKKLGIEVLKDGGMKMTQSPNNDTVHFVYTIKNKEVTPEEEVQRSSFRFVSLEEHTRTNPPSFNPKKITDLSGTVTYFSSSNESDRALENNQIPPELLDFFQYGSQRTLDSNLKEQLRIWAFKKARLQDSIDKTRKFIPIKAGNFIAWYRTDEEVLKVLPYIVANSIRAELSGKDVIIQTEEFREEYPARGFCYLDLCEKASGAIVCAAVSPNPATDRRTVLSYELIEERGIVTALYDLSGRKLRELSPLKSREKGRHEEEISLAGVEKGIYMIAIITDKGEKLSRRLIVD